MICRFGSLARLTKPLTLRSDNGLVFTSKRFTVTVQRYGLQQEFIQPHTPQQNGMIERLFRTMKEQCIWLTRFESLDEARSVDRLVQPSAPASGAGDEDAGRDV